MDEFDKNQTEILLRDYIDTKSTKETISLSKSKKRASQKHGWSVFSLGLTLICMASLFLGALGTGAVISTQTINWQDTRQNQAKSNYSVVSAYFQETVYLIQDEVGNKGVMDHNGAIIIPMMYKDIVPIRQNRYCVTQGEHDDPVMGIIDDKGQIVSPFQYDSIHFEYDKEQSIFSNVGIARLSNDATYILINADGKPYDNSKWLFVSFSSLNTLNGYKTDAINYQVSLEQSGKLFEKTIRP